MPNLTAERVIGELRRDVRHWSAWKATHLYAPALARAADDRIAALQAAIVCVEAVRDVDPTVFDRIGAALGEGATSHA